MLVVDTSAITEFLVGVDARAENVRAACVGERLAAPHAIDLECASSLRGMVFGKKLPPDKAEKALQTLRRMPIRHMAHRPLLPRIWELHDNMWPYDAAYVALAERLGAELLTTDGKFSRVPGVRCPVNYVQEL